MELIKQSIIINPVKRKPVPVRSLADKLADPNTLTLPFTKAEVSAIGLKGWMARFQGVFL